MDHKSFKATHLPNGEVQYYYKRKTRWYKISEKEFKELWK